MDIISKALIRENDWGPEEYTGARCIFLKVYDIPLWIPVNSVDDFVKKAKASERITQTAEKAIRQLREIAKLAKEIEDVTADSE